MILLCCMFGIFWHVRAITDTECASLKDFYTSLNGNHWINKSGWPFWSPNNITCNDVCKSAFPFGISCTGTIETHISAIMFVSENNLNGTIPSTISDLQFIKTFSLVTQSHVHGWLPNTLYSIPSLVVVSIFDLVSLNVCIGNEICNGKQIETLQIVNIYHLSGTISDCIGNLTNLNNLIITGVDDSSFGGTIPVGLFELIQLGKLSIIQLDNIGLEGALPEMKLGTNINVKDDYNYYKPTALNTLDLSFNRLNGTIGDNFCDIFGITTYIYLEHNQFSGTIPHCVLKLSKVEYYKYDDWMILMELSYNYFTSFGNGWNHNYSCIDDDINITINSNTIARNDTVFIHPIFLDLSYNRLNGTLPIWFTSCFYQSLDLSFNNISGTLPSGFKSIFLDLGHNGLSGTIPDQLYNDNMNNKSLYLSSELDLSNNQFSGSFPSNIINSMCLNLIILSENRLTHFPFDALIKRFKNIHNGSCAGHSDSILLDLLLDNNGIKQDNIGEILLQLLQMDVNLTVLTLHNNRHISGKIDALFDVQDHHNYNYNYNHSNDSYYNPGASQLTMLTMHNNDISGRLPKTMSIPNIQFLTLYNNRLSCDIPKHLDIFANGSIHSGKGSQSYIERFNKTYLILFGNLFNYDPTKQRWLEKDSSLSKYFAQATSLYLTETETIIYYILIGLGLCAVLVVILVGIMLRFSNYNLVKNINILYNIRQSSSETIQFKDEMVFLELIGQVYEFISNKFLIFVLILLTIIYYITSNYYECGEIISHFSLTYVKIIDEYNSEIDMIMFQVIIVACLVLFNIVCCWQLLKLHKYIKHMRVRKANMYTREVNPIRVMGSEDIDYSDKPVEPVHVVDDYSYNYNHNYNYNYQDTNENHYNKDYNDETLCATVLKFVVWLFLLLLNVFITMVYFISASLPNENILNLNHEWQDNILHYGLALWLTISNIFVIPKFTDSIICKCCKCCKCCNSNSNAYITRAYIIFTLRSIIAIGVPLLTSVLFLNNCLGYWTYLWKPCIVEDEKVKFNIDLTLYEIDVELSSYKDICEYNRLESMDDVTVCLRSYFDIWIPIVTVKLLLFIINPWIMFGYKLLFDKCCKYNRYGNGTASINMTTKIDSEYAVLANKLEFCIVYGIISPYLVFVTCVAVLSNYFFYSMVGSSKYRWQVSQNVAFPFFGLIVSLVMQQLLTVLFCCNVLMWQFALCLGILILIVDSVFVIFLRRNTRELRPLLN